MKNYAKTFYNVEVEVYYEGHEEYPSIDVRCPNLRDYYDEIDIAKFLEVRVSEIDALVDTVFEGETEAFWLSAQSLAEDIFGPGVEVLALGRSGRHLCVSGLPEIFLWKKRQTAKWQKFVRTIETIIDSYTEVEVVAQLFAAYLGIAIPEKVKS